jgi:Glyoxalase-like domain
VNKLGAVLAATLLVGAAPSRPLVEGLDHVPVAVGDLDKAAADFGRLGFIIKPGRRHDDGIRNKHVKFPNGGGIELITAASPTDDLAREYADWLRDGDGPAFWSLYSSDLASLTTALAAAGFDPVDKGDLVTSSKAEEVHQLFFADRLRSPTDGPNYWAHPNTAYKLAAVWLAGDPREVKVIALLGAKRSAVDACAPFDAHAAAYVVPGEGDAVMVTGLVHRAPKRSMLGLTVLVRNLVTARQVLQRNGVPYRQPPICGNHSFWIAPAQAHGLWLELSDRNAGAALSARRTPAVPIGRRG